MKHSDPTYNRRRGVLATILLWAVPLLLLIPNVILDFTEIHYTAFERAVNVLLPAGIYLLLMALWRRNGVMTLCLFPVMFLCAFQIVLLFLYGESIIAIDMFLNVATTNMHEATELLRNLGCAIVVVCLLYLPPVVLGIMAIARKSAISSSLQRTAVASGIFVTAAGALCALFAAVSPEAIGADRRLFPVNVISNMFTAIGRTEASDAYFDTSDAFRFHSCDISRDTVPEVVVLVIGETSRADNWQLNGYERPTNPRLSARRNLVSFDKALSESNTTHKSVPLLMTHLSAREFGDSIYCCRSVIDAFDEAGYRTAWISNQQRNGSLIDFFGDRAEHIDFINDDGLAHYDMELCPRLAALLDTCSGKLFVALHTYGSHFNYTERYPEAYAAFGHDIGTEASADNRKGLIDAYDNTILYTDAVLDSIMSTLEGSGRPAALVYLADHGEDIFDDSRDRFLHASPTPTFRQIHVPVVVWASDRYIAMHPGKIEAARANSHRNVSSSSSAFHTLLSLADIATPCYNARAALTEPSYREPRRIYLNDYNEGVELARSGLREPDFTQLKAHNITY